MARQILVDALTPENYFGAAPEPDKLPKYTSSISGVVSIAIYCSKYFMAAIS
ncbi:hypothetical protein [Pontibacter chinhatensis]|uniref:hypothetical protein n=1 Tax=Pontibacter chinhatensis TaxID=1436961 RepID=UPI0015872C7D|nr:hypothetical protein [Pontibacter chinhatensis]